FQPCFGQLADLRLNLACAQDRGEFLGEQRQPGAGEAAHRGKHEVHSRSGRVHATGSVTDGVSKYSLTEQVIYLRSVPGQLAKMLRAACLTPRQHQVDLAHVSRMEVPRDLDQPSAGQPSNALTVTPVAEIIDDRGFVVRPDGRDFERGGSPIEVMQDRV